MMTLRKIVLAVAVAGTFALGAAGPAQAAPIASAASVLSFENFTLSWVNLGRQVDAATDFASLSVTSSQLTAANMTGTSGVSENPSSSVGNPLSALSSRGVVDPVINATAGDTTQAYNVPTLPMAGNFSLSASNEVGAPIANFPNSTTPVQANADLHNASYASLDTLAGTAGTSSSSTLASTQTFTNLVGGDSLLFEFDLGTYIGAFLDLGAAQSALASWSVSFTLINTTAGSIAAFFSAGDTISNNAPGSGTTLVGAINSSVTGGFVDVTSQSFSSVPLIAGNTYQLSAAISTRTQVERVEPVPEPGVLALLGLGLVALTTTRRSQKRA